MNNHPLQNNYHNLDKLYILSLFLIVEGNVLSRYRCLLSVDLLVQSKFAVVQLWLICYRVLKYNQVQIFFHHQKNINDISFHFLSSKQSHILSLILLLVLQNILQNVFLLSFHNYRYIQTNLYPINQKNIKIYYLLYIIIVFKLTKRIVQRREILQLQIKELRKYKPEY